MATARKDNLSGIAVPRALPTTRQFSQLRKRQQRNLLATLLLSQGVPMILAGDEWGRTQQGNNNPYCQDNELSWLDWNLDAEQSALLEFVCTLVRLKLDEPVLHRPKFFQGRPIRGTDIRDIWWLESNGRNDRRVLGLLV